ncbi:MAG: hypothetical protein NC483_07380 [Ruminococcus sp.]|nr:hypothetical protein [Ruminococcus sp.]
MFGAPVNSGLTLGKVVSGLSKTLSIANQVIPLYREAKPMINNAKTILSVLKGMNNTNNTNGTNNNIVAKTNNKALTNTNNTTSKPIRTNYNNPTFFL